MVARTVAMLWGDGWLPVKVINPSQITVSLRKNATLVNVFPFMALEDFDFDCLHVTDDFPSSFAATRTENT